MKKKVGVDFPKTRAGRIGIDEFETLGINKKVRAKR